MAKYKIIPSSRTIVQSPISIGHKAEKGVEAIEFDLTAWVETYGSGTLTVIMRRWGDAIPYPIALEIDENNKAVWTLSDTDTAKAGMAYAQLNYIVGDEVVKKSDIYTFRVMDSLVGEGEPPEAYESWLEHLTHLAAEAMAEVLDIEGIVTDKTLTVDGGIADGKATGDALALKADKSTTYTKTEVDQMIEDVEVETDTTLEVAGAPADAAETGRQIGLLKADLDANEAEVINTFNDVFSLSDITKRIRWEHGGINNGTGETNNEGSLSRSRDKNYYKESDFLKIINGSNVLLYVIRYTYVNDTYTFVDNIRITEGGTHLFNQSSTYYMRFDIRGGFDEADKVELLYTAPIVEAVNRYEAKEHFFGDIPERKNLLDNTDLIANSYISNASGRVLSIDSNWYATQFMPVRAGVTYYTGGLYASYTALYDEFKAYLSGNVVDSDGTFTPASNGYFRATITQSANIGKCYVSPYYNYYTDYEDIDYTVASYDLLRETQANARGEKSSNHLNGSCVYGALVYATGAEKFSPSQIITPYIPISGTVFYKFFGGKQDDVKYIFEYAQDKSFISYATLSGKTVGYSALNANTRYVRFMTLPSSGSYTLPDPADMSTNFVVADSFDALSRKTPNHNIVGQNTVKYNLFDISTPFEKAYVADAIQSYADSLCDNFYDFVMPMHTDLHTINPESYKMLAYMSESGVADICVNLGDNIPQSYADKNIAIGLLKAIRLWASPVGGKCDTLVLRGNHDNNPSSDEVMISDALWYNIYQSRTKKGFYKSGLNYGYLDFEQSKIRLIWLDSGDIYDKTTGNKLTNGLNVMVQQDQFDWFCETALDFGGKSDKTEWGVITVSHAQIEKQISQAFAVVLKAFIDGSTATGSKSTIYGDYTNTLAYDVDYTSQGAMTYICHINGHTHNDDANLIGETGKYDIDIACENGTAHYFPEGTVEKNNNTRVDYTRTAGTIEEHLMDTLCIDKAERKIYMKRLGVGQDREFSY